MSKLFAIVLCVAAGVYYTNEVKSFVNKNISQPLKLIKS